MDVDVIAGDGSYTADLSTLSGPISSSFAIVDTAGNSAFVTGNSVDTTIQAAVSSSGGGDTIFIANGNYSLGTSTLNIDKSLTIMGQSEAVVVIDGSGIDGYGILVTSDNTSLAKFTLNGPTAGSPGGNYGLKIQPDSGVAGERLLNLSIEDIEIGIGMCII